MSFRTPRSRIIAPMWDVDMANAVPAKHWLVDQDWLVGGILCALPVLILIGICFML